MCRVISCVSCRTKGSGKNLSMNRNKEDAKLEPPPVKTNEANLEELNKKIVEIKRKIVLSGECFVYSLSRDGQAVRNLCRLFSCRGH